MVGTRGSFEKIFTTGDTEKRQHSYFGAGNAVAAGQKSTFEDRGVEYI
jgi:hypothetical protein